MIFVLLIFYSLLLALFGGGSVWLCALIVRGRGVPKTLHQPRLGWAAVGCHLVLCLIVLFLLSGNGNEEVDGSAITGILAGFPWSMLVGWTLHPLVPEWWDMLQNIALAVSFAINSAIAYQIGKRLPVIRAARPIPPPAKMSWY